MKRDIIDNILSYHNGIMLTRGFFITLKPLLDKTLSRRFLKFYNDVKDISMYKKVIENMEGPFIEECRALVFAEDPRIDKVIDILEAPLDTMGDELLIKWVLENKKYWRLQERVKSPKKRVENFLFEVENVDILTLALIEEVSRNNIPLELYTDITGRFKANLQLLINKDSSNNTKIQKLLNREKELQMYEHSYRFRDAWYESGISNANIFELV